MTDVTIHQITSRMSGMGIKAFMNVDESDLYVHVWTSCYNSPTYLLQDKFQVGLIQFDSQQMADEWLNEHKNFRFMLLDNENLIRSDTTTTAEE